MQVQQSAPFFSKNQIPKAENPLSSQGRFNRLSYIAWLGLLHVIFSIALIALSVSFGVLNLNTLHISQAALESISGISGWVYWILSGFYLYCMAVVIIRRLHDLNQSGWCILFLLIPIVQFFTGLYLIFARGCNRANRFGHPRPSTLIEKLIAWLIMIVFVVSLFASAAMIAYIMATGHMQGPTHILQQGTAYF